MKWLVALAILFLIGIAGAQDLTSNAGGASFSLSHASGLVIYNDTIDGFSLSHTTLVDGGLYNPTYVGPNALSTTWGTGTNAGTSDVLMTYTKNTSNILKGVIVLKSPHTITFPITLPAGEQIIPYAGGFRITGNDPISQANINNPMNGGIPAGIQISAPTATDANNSAVNVWYSLDKNNVITLNTGNELSGAPAVYPLIVDPTYYLPAYNAYQIYSVHFNGTQGQTTFTDETGKTITNNNSVIVDTSVPRFGTGFGNFTNNGGKFLSDGIAAQAQPLSANYNITMDMWVNVSGSVAASPALLADQQGTSVAYGFCVCLDSTRHVLWYIFNGHSGQYVISLTSTGTIPNDNKWHNLIFQGDCTHTTGAMYIDGVANGSQGYGYDPASNNPPSALTIGNYPAGNNGFGGGIDELNIWAGASGVPNIPLNLLYPQLTEVGSTEITPTFTATPLGGVPPFTTQFNDTTTGAFTINSWDWGFGDGTANATTQNPSHTYTSNGFYTVYLNITNTSYAASSILTMTSYISVNRSFPAPAFTANTTYGNVPLPIKFTDQSLNTTMWNWTFGDGNVSTSQNPVFTYNIAGTYSVNLTASNIYGNTSLVKTNYIQVNAIGYPYASFVTSINSGSPGLLVAFTDTSSQGKVAGETYTWNFNDPLSTAPTSSTNGSVTHVFAYAGVYYPTLTISNSVGTNTYAGAAITVSVQQNQQNSWYAPSQVRFTFQNMTGSSLSGILISATPQNMSAPPAWINTFFGVNTGVNLINTTVQGYTASDGAITMPMMQSILYTMSINGTASDGEVVPWIMFNMYPSQSDYLFNIPTTISPGVIPTAPATNKITYSVTNSTYNATAQYYNVTYYDPTGGTSNITYYVNDMNGTALYTQTVTGSGANSVSFSQIISNPNGGTITTGFYATQSSLGTVSSYDAVSFGNFVSLMGMAVPTWVESWLALGLIILVACSFSYFSVPVGGVILIGLTGYFVWGIKWLQPIYGYSAMGTGLMILGMWAAIKYIRAREDRLS